MDVHALAWILLIGLITTMLVVDFVGHVKTPHAPTLREAAWWSVAYVAMALVFGVIVWWVWGPVYGGEYFAGYITEKSLSVDNLFVFVIIIASFRVPRKYQQEVLLAGIIIALVLRGAFIAVGVAAINHLSWIFYIFGAFLLYTAWAQVRQGVETGESDEEYSENGFVRFVRRLFPVTDDYVDGKLVAKVDGRRMITPMLLVIIAIGTADVIFAVDSIPAIFGLTQEPYLVFAANAFSLLGLRQLYFLIDGLLDRLVYLHYGLAAILAFIGFKLVVHALHTNELGFINDGEEWHAIPEPGIAVSLVYIIGVLAITVVASLARNRKMAVLAQAQEHVETTPRDGAVQLGSEEPGIHGAAGDAEGDTAGPDPAGDRDGETRKPRR